MSSLCDILARRAQILRLRTPPIRLELQNPYTNTNFTQEDLNMRRKAEILQYNKTSNVQGKLTRAQRYQQISQGIGNRGSQTLLDVSGEFIGVAGTVSCPLDLYLPTPSSRSDIPGPPIILQYDKDVPLYNYATNAQQLGVPNVELMNAWSFNTSTNTLALSENEVTLMHIFHNVDNIDSEIINKLYTFTLNIPIGLYVAGDISGNLTPDLTNSVSINTFDVNIYANQSTDALVEPAIALNLDIIKDTSMNYIIDSSNAFYATSYVGNVVITTPPLLIEQLSIYDIKIKVKNSHSVHAAHTFNTLTGIESSVPTSGIYLNLTPNNISAKNNISYTAVPSLTRTHSNFKITATTS